ncbi:maleylacetoacetate isomerase [Tropicimonas sp. IMCC34011]|uniref:maleylacetoacetate isomerase n=1 Tax=Tropicimonas sp. IMCC34011 TaxID=2248759 RepID=UPI000E27A863|nr:maleylacetoacetate isomerase [Tropicimonas sp. IMCC34011]
MSAVLHDYWRSSASYRVRIALNLAGIAYETVQVDLSANAQRSRDHLSRNPQGFVPVLEIDGLRLTQSLAIVEYLSETRGLGLVPADAPGRARVRAIALAIAADTHPVCNLSVLEEVLRHGPAEDHEPRRVHWMRHFIRRGLVAVEALLEGPRTGRFCNGNAVSLADICLVPQVYNAERWGAPIADLPRIARIAGAVRELDAVRAVAPEAVRPAPEPQGAGGMPVRK